MGIWEREARALGYTGDIFLLNSGTDAEKAEVIGWTKDSIVVISHDAYWRPLARTAILKWQPPLIAMDEATAIKDRRSKRSKFAHILGKKVWAKYRIPMTGTPITNSPLDVFSIFNFMDHRIFGDNWRDFEDRYVRYNRWVEHKIDGYNHLDEIKAKIEAASFFVSRSEALPDLPPVMPPEIIDVSLSDKTKKHYKEMAKNSITEIDGDWGTKAATAPIILTRLMRLQQITSGFITTELPDGRAGEIIDIGDEKLTMCCDMVDTIREGGDKVIIFCRFKHSVRRLREALQIPWTHVLWGETSGPARKQFEDDHLAGKIDVAVLQIKVGSQALDLVQANHCIYYEWDFSVTNFTQSKGRTRGSGQTKPCYYYYLVAPNTVDKRSLDDLQDDINIAGQIVDLDYVRSLLA